MEMETYHAVELARVTAGYDPKANKTTIRQWAIAATGPKVLTSPHLGDDLLAQAKTALRSSAEEALYEAIAAGYAMPGELAARLAAAWTVFWERFPIILQAKSKEAFDSFLDAIHVGLVEFVFVEDGLVLEAMAGQGMAKMYAAVYDAAENVVSGDAKLIAHKFFALMKELDALMVVDVHITVPREVTVLITKAVELEQEFEHLPERIAQLSEALKNAEHEAETRIAAVVAQITNLPQEVVEQFEKAGVLIEQDANRLMKLVPGGEPILEFGTELSKELGDALRAAGEAVWKEMTKSILTRAQNLAAELESLKTQIEQAIGQGATAAVYQLSAAFSEVKKEFQGAQEFIDHAADKLAHYQVQNLPDDLRKEMNDISKGVNELVIFVDQAPEAVLRQAAQIAEDAIRAAADLISNALEDARHAVERFLGI